MANSEQSLRSPPEIGSGAFSPNLGSPQTPPNRSMWFLSGRAGEADPVRYFPVHSSPFLIGRRAACELQLTCPTVSSVHAEFIDHGSTAALRDLGSTNGTFVNGKRLVSEAQLASGDLIQFATQAFRVLKQDSSANPVTACENVCDQAMALVLFDRLITENAVMAFYQPIVNLRTRGIEGLEVLCRSRLAGLETPFQMFSAAAQLDQEVRLSQTIRWKACQEVMGLEVAPHLFMNTHPVEIQKPGLMESLAQLREAAPSLRLTLEIHEAAITDTSHMKRLSEDLKSLDVRLAFDDFGAGQARIVELTAVHPDYLKFDISLIHDIHLAAPDHKQMVAHLVKMVRDLGILALAEGVESAEDAATCCELGFDLAQGYFFGRPAPMNSQANSQGVQNPRQTPADPSTR